MILKEQSKRFFNEDVGELFTSYENEEKQKYKQVTHFEPCKIQIGCWKKTTVKFDKHVIDELRALICDITTMSTYSA